MARKPNLIIAGAQKSGTSWLHAKLRQHPDVFMPPLKELNYFNRLPDAVEADYLAQFEEAKNERYVGEATPHYFWKRISDWPYCEPPGDMDVATEMRRVMGDEGQLIISLRDPVSRAVSGWHHNICMGRNPQHMGMLDCPPSMGIVDLGMYARHWDHFENLFGRENMHVVLYDDLQRSPRNYLGWVLHLLGLKAGDDYYEGLDLADKINTKSHLKQRLAEGEDLPKADPAEIKKLLKLYDPHIDRVEAITGRSLANWRDLGALQAQHC